MHTDPLTGARYPDSTDAPNVSQFIQEAVNDLSDQVVPRFTTAAARDSAYTAWVAAGNTMTNGLVCTVGGELQCYRGAWKTQGGTLYRRVTATATGTLTSGTTANLTASQTGIQSLFGTSVNYWIDVDVVCHATIPAGLGGTLTILVDGLILDGDEFTNGGTSTCKYTFKARSFPTFADNTTHTIVAQVTAEAGTITLDTTYGRMLMVARPYVTF